MAPDVFIGLISGTSMDGIDAIAARFGRRKLDVLDAMTRPYGVEVERRLRRLVAAPDKAGLLELGRLDVLVAREFAEAVTALLSRTGLEPAAVAAVGSHGQTVLHDPATEAPFSMQLGEPACLAVLTGLTVVADFRNGDMALGGQGAPLVPPFHRWLFADQRENRAVVNIGGIANVTLLPAHGAVTAFDTGPGNTLLDAWAREHRGTGFDEHGSWAASAAPDARLLARLLADPYFARTGPKSTGPEYFNLAWLRAHLDTLPELPAAVVQATLSELTARTVVAAVTGGPRVNSLAVCGGGAHNRDLMARLRRHAPGIGVATTDQWGLAPDWVEAAAFAWLARERLASRPSSLGEVTGARASLPLGGIYLPPHPL